MARDSLLPLGKSRFVDAPWLTCGIVGIACRPYGAFGREAKGAETPANSPGNVAAEGDATVVNAKAKADANRRRAGDATRERFY